MSYPVGWLFLNFVPNWHKSKYVRAFFRGVRGFPLAANPPGGLACINLRRSEADRV